MLLRIFTIAACIAMAHAAVVTLQDQAFSSDLWIRDFKVPTADDPSLSIFVRNKFLRSGSAVGVAAKTVIFIAGATYPTSTAFDLELGGTSWMDYIARNDYDVWMLDQRGYGRSDRPIQMSQNASLNGPICNTSVVAGDVYTIVQFIQQNRSVAQLNVMGWSWGTSIMSLFSSLHPDLVLKLVLYSPQWVRAPNPAPTTAYRTVDRATALARWMNGVKIPQSQLIPFDGFDVWWNATVVLDPVGYNSNPPVVRAPNGISYDNSVYWGNGIPVYNITKLTMPVLIVHGEWDVDLPYTMTQGVWFNLTSNPNKRWVEIAKGTHTICLEMNRMQLFRAVQDFLDEPNPISLVPQSSTDFLAVTAANALANQIVYVSYETEYHGAIAAAVVMGVLALVLLIVVVALVVSKSRHSQMSRNESQKSFEMQPATGHSNL